MSLRKPSELLDKKEVSVVFESPEISSYITESYDKFLNNFERVNELSEKVEELSQQLSEKLSRTELENAMLSQLMVLDENFKTIQNHVKGLNKEDLKEFKETVYNLTEIVDNLLETELPKYKKQVVKNKVFVGEQVHELQGFLEENITGIREEIDEKFGNIAEVIDNNLEYFNNQLQETSSQVKKTTETYHNLSKIVENKVSRENERLDEYFNIIESIQKSLTELKSQIFLNENTFEKIDNYLENEFERIDNYLEQNHENLVKLKEEVFIEIEKLPVGNLQENIERLERKIDFIKETYSKIEPEVVVKEVIKEGLLNEPPETDNSDPLTPLNQNFVTLNQLQEHYRLFLNRIQQQLSTLGGGGETRLKYLDDIVGIATNASAYDGKYLTYNHSLGQFEFADVDISNDSWADGLNGPYTLGSVGIGTSSPTTSLDVVGDVKVSGIVTTSAGQLVNGVPTFIQNTQPSSQQLNGLNKYQWWDTSGGNLTLWIETGS